MESYLIRIYRRDKKNPEAIIGIIEEIGADKQESFGNLSELTSIISNPCVAEAMQGKEGTHASLKLCRARDRNKKTRSS